MNIIYSGYASLDPLFEIAPWIFLFLAPAVAMRLIAEERRTGTIELLLLRPMSTLRIVCAKYLAGLTLMLISIATTVVYVFVVWQLGSPQGNIDVGGTIGSYIGLVALAAIYMAIGVFASSITDNQIVAFVTGIALCFVFYIGFDSLSEVPALKHIAVYITALGIDSHYASISRGVVDSRDVVYFVSVIALFIGLSCLVIDRRLRSVKFIAWAAACIAALNFGASQLFLRFDLTTEKRFTLASVSVDYLASLENDVTVKLYLDGDLNAGFNRLRKSVCEMFDELNINSPRRISYISIDPMSLSKKELEQLNDDLADDGLGGVPVFETKEDGQKIRSLVYPYAQMQCGDKYLWTNLLENVSGLSGEENLNRSIENLEYKLLDGLRRLNAGEPQRVAFLEGHGELDEIDVVEAADALSKHFAVDRGAIASDASVLDNYKVVIVAKPTQEFSERDKYVIDQYVMNGGRVLWLVDAVTMTLDSLRNSPHTVGLLSDYNLDDMLFVYGVRLNPDVVEDLSCSMIPVSVANGKESTQLVPMPWTFSPMLGTNMLNPITKNVNYVRADFASYIDTVGEDLQLNRVSLLRTSQFTKVNNTPVFATLSTIHQQPDRAQYNHQNLDVALLEEGVFKSVFARRHAPTGLQNTKPQKDMSEKTKMVFVADGDIIRNDVRLRNSPNPTIVPLGYDELSRQTFGNKDFIVNAVQYLADDDGWMNLRNRTFSLRLLDREKIGEGTAFYKFVVIAFPLLFVVLCGIVIVVVRRRKFAVNQKVK